MGDGARVGATVDDGKGKDVAVIVALVPLVGMIGDAVVVDNDELGTTVPIDDIVEMVGGVVALFVHPLPKIIVTNSKMIFKFSMITFINLPVLYLHACIPVSVQLVSISANQPTIYLQKQLVNL